MNHLRDLDKPIAREDGVIRRLRLEGWTGDAAVLRALAHRGEILRERWANSCSYEWAATDAYEAESERLQVELCNAAEEAGLTLYLQTDPRGAAVYVRGGGLPISPMNYSGDAQCLFYEREDSDA